VDCLVENDEEVKDSEIDSEEEKDVVAEIPGTSKNDP